MAPISLGIVGCGLAARNLHWPALQKLSNRFRIVAVCSRSESSAGGFAAAVGGIPYVVDYRELLEMSDVEAVDIVLPNPMHFAVAKDCLDAGKHVIVEKPIATTLEEASELCSLASRKSSVAMVAENFRYRRATEQVKGHLSRGEIGTPYAAFSRFLVNFGPENPYTHTEWRTNHEFVGGFITDVGIHYSAYLRDLFGRIDVLNATTLCVNPRLGKMDSISCQFKTRSDFLGRLDIFLSSRLYFAQDTLILGSEGSLRDLQVSPDRDDREVQLYSPHKQNSEIFENDGGFVEEFEDFADAIESERGSRSSFSEGFKDLSVILEALKAAQGGSQSG